MKKPSTPAPVTPIGFVAWMKQLHQDEDGSFEELFPILDQLHREASQAAHPDDPNQRLAAEAMSFCKELLLQRDHEERRSKETGRRTEVSRAVELGQILNKAQFSPAKPNFGIKELLELGVENAHIKVRKRADPFSFERPRFAQMLILYMHSSLGGLVKPLPAYRKALLALPPLNRQPSSVEEWWPCANWILTEEDPQLQELNINSYMTLAAERTPAGPEFRYRLKPFFREGFEQMRADPYLSGLQRREWLPEV